MNTPHLVRRFPLVARPRPACTPLEERVGELARLADTAHQDPVRASAVLNQAALLASDVGLPDLARTWCHAHACAQFTRLPNSAKEAIHALEPVVNLARLRIRDGDGDSALRLLEVLFEGVSTRTDTEVDHGLLVPCSQLTTAEEAHQEVRKWVWMVLLADGARAMTTAGRWGEALEHLHAHKGIGNRMSDGRQVAVLAHATSGDTSRALELLEATASGEPWEDAVIAVLTAMCCDRPTPKVIARMLENYKEVAWSDITAVFHTRLGLCVTDILGVEEPVAEEAMAELVSRVLAGGNGYCARELLEAAPQAALCEAGERLSDLVHECGLGRGELPQRLWHRLEATVQSAACTIKREGEASRSSARKG